MVINIKRKLYIIVCLAIGLHFIANTNYIDAREIEDNSIEISVSENICESEEESISKATYSMPYDYVLTSEAKLEKSELLSHIEEYGELVPGCDYADDEYVILTDTKEEAEIIANAYGAELINYDTGVATLKTKKDVSMEEILYNASSLNNNLPAIWPNFIRYADNCNKEESEIETTKHKDTTENIASVLTDYSNSKNEMLDNLVGNVDAVNNEEYIYNDPYLYSGSYDYQWYHSKVGSYGAWDNDYKGRGIRVAVLDTGVLDGHEDLPDIIALGCHEEDLTGASDSHGTHVAGIIGAKLDNGKGGSGIAPDVTLYSGCVIPGGSGTDSQIIAGINKAINARVNIINMSLGGSSYNGSFQTAITNAYNKGITVIAAAGNDGGHIKHYPASYDHVIGVGATNPSDYRASFSNYGDGLVDVSAPGTNIPSTSSYSEDSYEYMSGTSQAAPIVTGIVAVLLSSDSSYFWPGMDNNKRVDLVTRIIMLHDNIKVKSKGMGVGIPNLEDIEFISNAALKPYCPYMFIHMESTAEARISIYAQPGCDIYFRTDGRAPTYKNGMIDQDGKTYPYYDEFYITMPTTVRSIKAIAVNKAGVSSTVKTEMIPFKNEAAKIVISGATRVVKGGSSQLTATVYPLNVKHGPIGWAIYCNGYGNRPLLPKEEELHGITVSRSGNLVISEDVDTEKQFQVCAFIGDTNGVKTKVDVEILDNTEIASIEFEKDSITMAQRNVFIPNIKAFRVDGTKAEYTEFR